MRNKHVHRISPYDIRDSKYMINKNKNSRKETVHMDTKSRPRLGNFSWNPVSRFSIMEKPSEDMSTSTP